MMDGSYEKTRKGESENHSLKIISYYPYLHCIKFPSPWLDLKVFYLRISNFQVDSKTPGFLTLNLIPLGPDTLLEVNGIRHSFYLEEISPLLKRDRVDKNSEEATFVSTDSLRSTGSVRFEVFDKEDMIISGFLEMPKEYARHWSMNCESEISVGFGFLKGKHVPGSELSCPTFEVCVAGYFLGSPIILTKTLQLGFHKKCNRKTTLDSIPENDATECLRDVTNILHFQVTEDSNYNMENGEEYRNTYTRTDYTQGDDGDLSWFNAGVSVGVGIGLGICVGVSIGVGLLARSYQPTT